jgi:riboflavin transporter FmnP
MKTRTLSLIIIFTALAAALNIYGPKIPFPLAPFLYFTLWEIPIVIGFVMAGPKSGVTISIINTLILLVVFPGSLPTGPLYNLAAVLSMFIGIYLPYWFARKGCKSQNIGSYLRNHLIAFTLSATILGIGVRVLLLTIVNFFALQQPYPFGFSMPQDAVLLFLPAGAAFNAIVAAYTIPIAIGTTAAISSRIKT